MQKCAAMQQQMGILYIQVALNCNTRDLSMVHLGLGSPIFQTHSQLLHIKGDKCIIRSVYASSHLSCEFMKLAVGFWCI